jgi:gamma-glutamylcyclotransferase (GGCT)/AIG2-like uncharacterized protein YtfP
MKYPVFVYGTLLFPEVRRALLGREPATARAELRGYARYAIRSPGFEPFPVIVAEADAWVQGLLLGDLNHDEVDCLDCFENVAGGLYHKLVLSVSSESRQIQGVVAYAAGPRLVESIAEPWDPASFRRQGLSSFMRRCFGVVTDAEVSGPAE